MVRWSKGLSEHQSSGFEVPASNSGCVALCLSRYCRRIRCTTKILILKLINGLMEKSIRKNKERGGGIDRYSVQP